MSLEDRSLGGGQHRVNAARHLRWEDLAALIGSLAHRKRAAEGPARLALVAVRQWGAARAVVFGRRPEKPGFVPEGSAGLDAAPERSAYLEYGRRLTAWVERTRIPLVVDAPGADLRFEDPPPGLLAARAFPLTNGDEMLGALVILDEDDGLAAAFPVEERDAALLALAHLAALALDRDRSWQRQRELTKLLDEHERRLTGAERRAAAGEMALEIGTETRESLTGMAGLASRVAESLAADDPRRSLLERVVEEAARLTRLVGGSGDLARERTEPLEPDTVNRIMSESLALVRGDLAAARVQLTERLGSSLPLLLLDGELLRRSFLNMLRAGIASASPGGRLKVETKRRGEVVEVLVAADGERRPGRVLEDLWTPFRTDGGSGDPAPAAIDRVIREHRGTIRASASRDWPFSLVLTLPIAGNQDRRRTHRDRRRA